MDKWFRSRLQLLHDARARHPRTAIIAAMAASVAIVGAGVWVGLAEFGSSGGASASQERAFGDAVATLQQGSSQPVATINGVVIPASKVEAYVILSRANHFGDATPPASTPEQYVDSLISTELLYQEAVRRGIDPSDAQVLDLASQTKAGLLSAMKENTEVAANLRDAFSQVQGTPYAVEAYDSSPEMLGAFRRQIAVNALREKILAQLSAADRQDTTKREATVAAFVATLRAKAEVKLFPLPSP